eukprot:CAMPEP_0194159092 /NCGR_PEP_ID=MMETSP0152-20130528/77633_1 /TAXON_ID=1049557 /ORGANISM="Thalassiothrix antarctica, Strain L6-D1" /LENGTH=1268 /DNA_ID=CAMNT_0038868611 /DNA_START=386 /DNA_END=4192 /DNA_ORIENTATION=-
MLGQSHHNQLQERQLLQSNDTRNQSPPQQSPVTYVLQELGKILPAECYPRPVSALESPDNLPFIQCPKEHRRYYDMTAINAISSQDVVTLRRWHLEGRPLQTSNERGETLLHMACRRALVDVVKFLVQEACVSLWVHDKKGRTPLHMACYSSEPGIFEVFHFIVKQDTDLLFVLDEQGCTPLDHIPCQFWNDWIVFFRSLDFNVMVPKRQIFLSLKYSVKPINESCKQTEDENILSARRNPKFVPTRNNCSPSLNGVASSPKNNARRGHRNLDNGMKYNSDEISKCYSTIPTPEAQSPSIVERTQQLSKLWQENSPQKFVNENMKSNSNRISKNLWPNDETEREGSGPGESSQLTPKDKISSSQLWIKKGGEIYDRGNKSNSTRELITDKGKSQKQSIQQNYIPAEPSPRKSIKKTSDGILIPKALSPKYKLAVEKSKEMLIPDSHAPPKCSTLNSSSGKKSDNFFVPISRSDDEIDRPHRRAMSGTYIDGRMKTTNTKDELIREKINMLKKNHQTSRNHIPSKPSPRRPSSRDKERNIVASMSKDAIEQHNTSSRSSSWNHTPSENDSCGSEICSAQSHTSTEVKPYRLKHTHSFPGIGTNGRVKDSNSNQEPESKKNRLTMTKVIQQIHAPGKIGVDGSLKSKAEGYRHSELLDRFENMKLQSSKTVSDTQTTKLSTTKEESISERMNVVRNQLRENIFSNPPKPFPQKSQNNVDMSIGHIQNKNVKGSNSSREHLSGSKTSSNNGIKYNDNDSNMSSSPLRNYAKTSNHRSVMEAHSAQHMDLIGGIPDQAISTRSQQPSVSSDDKKHASYSDHLVTPDRNRLLKIEKKSKDHLISNRSDLKNIGLYSSDLLTEGKDNDPAFEKYQNTRSNPLAIIERRWLDSMKKDTIENSISSTFSPPGNHRRPIVDSFTFEAHISQGANNANSIEIISNRSRSKKEVVEGKRNTSSKASPSRNNTRVIGQSYASELDLSQSNDSTHDTSNEARAGRRTRSRTRSKSILRRRTSSIEKKNVLTNNSSNQTSQSSSKKSDIRRRESRSADSKKDTATHSSRKKFSSIKSLSRSLSRTRSGSRSRASKTSDRISPVEFSDNYVPLDESSVESEDAKLKDELLLDSKESEKVKEQDRDTESILSDLSLMENLGIDKNGLFPSDEKILGNNEVVNETSDILHSAKCQSKYESFPEEDDCKDFRLESLVTGFDVDEIVLGHIHYEHGTNNNGLQICYLQLSLSASIAEFSVDMEQKLSSRPPKKAGRMRNKFRRLPSV